MLATKHSQPVPLISLDHPCSGFTVVSCGSHLVCIHWTCSCVCVFVRACVRGEGGVVGIRLL